MQRERERETERDRDQLRDWKYDSVLQFQFGPL